MDTKNKVKGVIWRNCKCNKSNYYENLQRIKFSLALEIMPKHIDFFMSAPPKFAPATIIKQIKGTISRRVRKMYPVLKKYRKKELWADSYYVGVAGHVSHLSLQSCSLLKNFYSLCFINSLQLNKNFLKIKLFGEQVAKKLPFFIFF